MKKKVLRGICQICTQPEFRGTRCWRHYVLRYCKRIGITQTAWFKEHETVWLYALRGRYQALFDGLEVPSVVDALEPLKQGRRRVTIDFTRESNLKRRDRVRLLKMVAHFDALARQERALHGDGDGAACGGSGDHGGGGV